MRVAGLVVMVAGLSVSVRSFQLLLGRGRPKRGPRPSFVLAGPYLRSRNPALSGILVCLLGLSLATGSILIFFVTVALAVAMDAWVRRVEEPRLRRRFGEAYEAYLRAVPRWIPSGRSRLPDVTT